MLQPSFGCPRPPLHAYHQPSQQPFISNRLSQHSSDTALAILQLSFIAFLLPKLHPKTTLTQLPSIALPCYSHTLFWAAKVTPTGLPAALPPACKPSNTPYPSSSPPHAPSWSCLQVQFSSSRAFPELSSGSELLPQSRTPLHTADDN